MKFQNDLYSCYDELFSSLLIPNLNEMNDEKYIKLTTNNKNSKLTSQEIIVYSLLLSKCIENKNEEQTISYIELQQLRNKRFGSTKALDGATLKAYDKAFYSLGSKNVEYNIKKRKITYHSYSHPFLIIYKIKKFENGNKIIDYSLGPFGKTLVESKRYSTLLPIKFFQIKFNEIMTYEIGLYICKLIFIERRKKKQTLTIKLNSILKNTCKFVYENNDYISYCSCLDYKGANIKRLYTKIIDNVEQILKQMQSEYKIKKYNHVTIKNQTIEHKWLLELNK